MRSQAAYYKPGGGPHFLGRRARRRQAIKLLLCLLAVLGLVLAGPGALMVNRAVAGCYTAASHTYGYGATYYPTSYSYYTPSYTYYTPTYYTPKYEVNEVIVPKAVKAYVSPDYFASVSDYYRDKLLVDAISGKNTDTLKLQEELRDLKEQLRKSQTQPTQPTQPAQYAPPAATGYPSAPYQYGPPAPLPPAQPPQYQSPGGTPCDWRAQSAYQQGLKDAQQQAQAGGYGAQQAPTGQPGYGQGQATQGGYGPPQAGPGAGSQPPAQSYSQGGGQGYEQRGSANQNYEAPRQPQPQSQPQGPAPTQPPSRGYSGGQAPAPPVPGGGSNDGDPSPLPPTQGTPIEGQAKAFDYGPAPEGLEPVVKAECLRCHGASNEELGHGFDMRDLRRVSGEKRMESWAMAAAGEMPFKASALSPEKVRLFKAWHRMARKQGKTVALGNR